MGGSLNWGDGEDWRRVPGRPLPGSFTGVVVVGPSAPWDGYRCSFVAAHLYLQSWALSTTLVARLGLRPSWVPALLLPLKPFFPCENSSRYKGGLRREVEMCIWWSCSQVAAPRLLCHLHAGQVGVSEGLPWGRLKPQRCFVLCAVLPGGIPKAIWTEAEVCVCKYIYMCYMCSSVKYERHVSVASDSSRVTGTVSSGGFTPL